MSVEHFSEWGWDDDGFITLECSCGWGPTTGLPDAETAGDVWGDHMYDAGYDAGKEHGGV